VLLAPFGMGAFVIVAAVLAKLYCIVPSLISNVYINWSFREASTALYVTNLPMTWSLLCEIFTSLRGQGTTNDSPNRSRRSWPSTNAKEYSMSSLRFPFQRPRARGDIDDDLTGFGPTEIQEHINPSIIIYKTRSLPCQPYRSPELWR
jgi:hypothetical protein